MRHETQMNAHPSHHAAHGAPFTDGHRDKPSPSFDANDADGFSRPSPWRVLPLSAGLTIAIGLALSLLGAALVLSVPDPWPLLMPAAWAAVGLASLAGGLIAGRLSPDAPVAAGLLSGGVLLLLLTIAGLCLGENTVSVWILRLCVLPLHLIGALLSRRRPKPAAHTAHRAGAHHRR